MLVDVELVRRSLPTSRIRDAIRAELDAITLYEEIARSMDRPDIAKVFRDIAFEEKVHLYEFLFTLALLDSDLLRAASRARSELQELGVIKD